MSAMFTAPTAIRAVKKEDRIGAFMREHDLSSLCTPVPAGEPAGPGAPGRGRPRAARRAGGGQLVADRDRGGRSARNRAGPGRPADQGPVRRPCRCPGYDVRVLDPAGQLVPAGHRGRRPPCGCRCCCPRRRRRRATTSGTRLVPGRRSTASTWTGDGGDLDEDGHLFVMGRTDDVLNVAGYGCSTERSRRRSPATRRWPSAR